MQTLCDIILVLLKITLDTIGKGSPIPQDAHQRDMNPLLAIIALSAVQSFPRLLIHNAILFINTSTMLGTRKVIG